MRIALVDCNSFYASCETVFRPDLRNRPVVVLSNNDGCVVALNQAAKDLGIERTTPVFQIRNIVDRHGVIVFSSNYALYADISERVRSIYRRFSPVIEDYSIDESFLFFPDTGEIPAAEIKRTVQQWTGIPVSIGIGPTKTLAKLANKLSKKEPGGWLEIKPGEVLRYLHSFPVGKVWGIGPATEKALAEKGVTTAEEFAKLDPSWVRKRFTIGGWRTQRELLGEPQIDIEEIEAKENILFSRSFSHPIAQLVDLEESVAEYASGAGEKLRAQGSATALIQVFLTTNYFRLDEPQYSNTATVRLPHPTSYTPDLIGAAQHGLRQIYKTGFKFKKTGVMLLDLVNESTMQGSLFYADDPKLVALQAAVDAVNKKHGRDTLRCRSRRSSADWMMKRDAMSPHYTTRWDELLRVK